MIELVPAEQYKLVFYCTMFVICLLTGIYYLDSNSCQKLLKQNSALLPFLLTVILIIYIGLRPIRGRFFGDMAMYHHVWRLVDESSLATNLFESNMQEIIVGECLACRVIYFLFFPVLYVWNQRLA